jgi:hypothetical protein
VGGDCKSFETALSMLESPRADWVHRVSGRLSNLHARAGKMMFRRARRGLHRM